MANELVVSVTVNAGGVPLVATQQRASGSAMLVIQEEIAGSGTDVQVAASIDEGALEGLAILSDRDLTLKTNSSSVPDDTFALKAGVPVIWTTGSATAKPLGDDVTALFATNAGSQAAKLTIVAITDATP